MYAARGGRADCACVLVDAGADTNFQDSVCVGHCFPGAPSVLVSSLEFPALMFYLLLLCFICALLLYFEGYPD